MHHGKYQDNGFITTKVGLRVPQTKLKEAILDIGIKQQSLNHSLTHK
jgi:hypothetical protein